MRCSVANFSLNRPSLRVGTLRNMLTKLCVVAAVAAVLTAPTVAFAPPNLHLHAIAARTRAKSSRFNNVRGIGIGIGIGQVGQGPPTTTANLNAARKAPSRRGIVVAARRDARGGGRYKIQKEKMFTITDVLIATNVLCFALQVIYM